MLVSAPAGFGKTTLLSQWLAPAGRGDDPGGDLRVGPRVAWLSLDATDTDPRAFLSHLVAALQVPSPQVGVGVLALVGADGSLPVEEVVSGLVDDLDALSGVTVVALDDYHLVDTPEVDTLVGSLLDQLPPRVTIALTTRVDPPLPLAQLRARGELVEIRAAVMAPPWLP